MLHLSFLSSLLQFPLLSSHQTLFHCHFNFPPPKRLSHWSFENKIPLWKTPHLASIKAYSDDYFPFWNWTLSFAIVDSVFQPITIVSFCNLLCKLKAEALNILKFLGTTFRFSFSMQKFPKYFPLELFHIFVCSASCCKYSNPSWLQNGILLLQEQSLLS